MWFSIVTSSFSTCVPLALLSTCCQSIEFSARRLSMHFPLVLSLFSFSKFNATMCNYIFWIALIRPNNLLFFEVSSRLYKFFQIPPCAMHWDSMAMVKDIRLPATGLPIPSSPDSIVFDPSYSYMTSFGMTWCRVIAAIMAATAMYFINEARRIKRGSRYFHAPIILMHIITTYTYALMSLGQGFALIPVHYAPLVGLPTEGYPPNLNYSRQISFVRYVDWMITTPVCSYRFLSAIWILTAFTDDPRFFIGSCWSSRVNNTLHRHGQFLADMLPMGSSNRCATIETDMASFCCSITTKLCSWNLFYGVPFRSRYQEQEGCENVLILRCCIKRCVVFLSLLLGTLRRSSFSLSWFWSNCL